MGKVNVGSVMVSDGLLTSPTIGRLPVDARPWYIHDVIATDPAWNGTFEYSENGTPMRVCGSLAEFSPDQTPDTVRGRFTAYLSEGLLSLFSIGERVYGWWRGWWTANKFPEPSKRGRFKSIPVHPDDPMVQNYVEPLVGVLLQKVGAVLRSASPIPIPNTIPIAIPMAKPKPVGAVPPAHSVVGADEAQAIVTKCRRLGMQEAHRDILPPLGAKDDVRDLLANGWTSQDVLDAFGTFAAAFTKGNPYAPHFTWAAFRKQHAIWLERFKDSKGEK